MVGFGAPHAHVVAAVLLYRGVIVLPTLVVGAAALVWFRFGGRSAALTSTPASDEDGLGDVDSSR
jgi:hypothetical protein